MASSVFERPPRQNRRVVVTGIGTVNPLGLNLQETWTHVLAGKSGVGRIASFNAENYECKIAGEVKGFNPDLYIHKKEQKKMDTFIQFAMGASEMAIKDSGVDLQKTNAERIGVYIGTGIGGLPGIERQHQILVDRGPTRVSPFFIPMVISNLASGQVAIKFGLKGPNLSVATACATGAHAIGEAAKFIQEGSCDIMVAGGTEATVCPLAVGGFASMRALSVRNEQPQIASRPFDKDRDGFVLGEGAGILVLEDYEHASKRGAQIYGELTGYGLSCDAYHLTNPSEGGEGAARSMTMALRSAGLNQEQIQYVNAHGTSTPVGDIAETEALKKAFGPVAKKVWVSSTKSMTGHLLGAAGAVESIFCLMAIKTGSVPPTINLDHPSPECDLDYVPHVARNGNIRNVMNNSFGFGGTNCTVIFSKI
jgi:3-oxoacyl-[acyl-carrier-protein] synthase II